MNDNPKTIAALEKWVTSPHRAVVKVDGDGMFVTAKELLAVIVARPECRMIVPSYCYVEERLYGLRSKHISMDPIHRAVLESQPDDPNFSWPTKKKEESEEAP